MQSPIGPLDDDEDYDNAVVVTAATMMTTLTMMLTTRMMTTAMAMTQGDQLQVLIRHSLSLSLSLFFVTRSSSFFVQNCTDPVEILN